MATYRETKSIASDLLTSFVSRNNDLDGYWALGKLRSEAESKGKCSSLLPLIPNAEHRQLPIEARLVVAWRSRAFEQLERRHLNDRTLKELEFEVDFGLSPHAPMNLFGYGEPFLAKLHLATEHFAIDLETWGKCAAHDSSRESRSQRARSSDA